MIKKIYGKHTFCFSVFTVLLSVIVLLIFKNFKLSNQLIISLSCLFFILSFGISHGAMDNYKANKLLKTYQIKNKLIFFVIYILISAFVIFLWSLYTSYTLLINVAESTLILFPIFQFGCFKACLTFILLNL